jgi:predicted TIM-barrel enzyme
MCSSIRLINTPQGKLRPALEIAQITDVQFLRQAIYTVYYITNNDVLSNLNSLLVSQWRAILTREIAHPLQVLML